MRAHLVQYDIAWEDREANYERVRALVGAAPVLAGDLIVLPEMFDSGFSLNTERTGDREGRSRAFLSRLAGERSVWVVGGITVEAPSRAGMALNRCLVFAPSGSEAACYDKAHPFTFGREGERFVGGERLAWFDAGDGGGALRICPAVCYDLRFPELFRRGLAGGAEAFTVIANWPGGRAEHWRALLIARAIENQALVFGVNRCGHDPHLAYAGGSLAVGARGEVLGELGDEEGVLSVEVDAAAVRAWRGTFPAWRDGKAWLGGPCPG